MCSINKVCCLDSIKSTFSVTSMDAAERVCPNLILDHSLAFNVLGFFFFFFKKRDPVETQLRCVSKQENLSSYSSIKHVIDVQ